MKQTKTGRVRIPNNKFPSIVIQARRKGLATLDFIDLVMDDDKGKYSNRVHQQAVNALKRGDYERSNDKKYNVLTEEQVNEIIEIKRSALNKSLAKKYKVTYMTISNIKYSKQVNKERKKDSSIKKLTEEQVIEMLALSKTHKYAFLVKKYNVSISQISRIVSGKAWKHIDRS